MAILPAVVRIQLLVGVLQVAREYMGERRRLLHASVPKDSIMKADLAGRGPPGSSWPITASRHRPGSAAACTGRHAEGDVRPARRVSSSNGSRLPDHDRIADAAIYDERYRSFSAPSSFTL